MRPLFVLVAWFLLLVLCWPVALLALVLWPLAWLIALPFRVLGITFDAFFALMRAILMLPARLPGHRRSQAPAPARERIS
jgi:uncharacterized membrane protein